MKKKNIRAYHIIKSLIFKKVKSIKLLIHLSSTALAVLKIDYNNPVSKYMNKT